MKAFELGLGICAIVIGSVTVGCQELLQRSEPFDCANPPPPPQVQATFSQGTLNPPPQTGGTIPDGRYTLTGVTFHGTPSFRGVAGEVIDFRNGSYRRNTVFHNPVAGGPTGFTEVGAFETSVTGLLHVEGRTCGSDSTRSEVWEFSANGSELVISSVTPGRIAYQVYERSTLSD